MNKGTVNAGVRAEEWSHFSSAGDNVMTFDWEVAPRLSVVFDLNGDGRSKVWGYMGRYYDPIRTNMTNFAGNLTGSVLDEQITIGNQWLPFRPPGGPETPAPLIPPPTNTPHP